MISQEQGSVSPSQASLITDSARASEVNQKEWLKKGIIQAKQKPAISATKSNLDAESGIEANKPLTRARARIIAVQNSQANENHPRVAKAEYEIMPTQALAPSGSRLTIKRLKTSKRELTSAIVNKKVISFASFFSQSFFRRN